MIPAAIARPPSDVHVMDESAERTRVSAWCQLSWLISSSNTDRPAAWRLGQIAGLLPCVVRATAGYSVMINNKTLRLAAPKPHVRGNR